MILKDALAYILGGTYLGTLGLYLLLYEGEPGGRLAPMWLVLHLLAACGAMLAIAAAELWAVWMGLALHTFCWGFLRRVEPAEDRHSAPALGLGASLFGLAMLYAGVATLNAPALSQRLWQLGRPGSALLYGGVALTLGGFLLGAGLLPPYPRSFSEGEPLPTLLGVAVLVRLCPFTLGALGWEWSRVLLAVALGLVAWGVLGLLRAQGTAMRLERLGLVQRGFLTLALALCASAAGLAALLLALPAWALGQMVLGAYRQEVSALPEKRPVVGRPRTWRATNLWLGVPLVISLLSQASLPLTLGFAARAALLWAAQGAGMVWLVLLGLAASLLCVWPAVRLALAVARAGGPRRLGHRGWQTRRVGLALAAALLVGLGLYPWPLVLLALRIAGQATP